MIAFPDGEIRRVDHHIVVVFSFQATRAVPISTTAQSP